MPETPDFDQIARTLIASFDPMADPFVEDARPAIAEQLRLVWNARGAADRATIDAIWSEHAPLPPYLKRLDSAMRTLDR